MTQHLTTTEQPQPHARTPARASPSRYTPQGGRVAQLCFAAPSAYYVDPLNVDSHESHETVVGGGA
jgi:hypothetical protein